MPSNTTYKSKPNMTEKKIREIAKKASIDISGYRIEQLVKGYDVELEHGSKLGEETNITNDDPVMTLKIEIAHLKERDDYYDALLQYVENKTYVTTSRTLENAYVMDHMSFVNESLGIPGLPDYTTAGGHTETKERVKRKIDIYLNAYHGTDDHAKKNMYKEKVLRLLRFLKDLGGSHPSAGSDIEAAIEKESLPVT